MNSLRISACATFLGLACVPSAKAQVLQPPPSRPDTAPMLTAAPPPLSVPASGATTNGGTPTATETLTPIAPPVAAVPPPAATQAAPAQISPAQTLPAQTSPAQIAPVMPTPAATVPAPAGPTRSPTLDIVNNATLTDTGDKDGVSPALLRAEIMLDRLHASPGVIDGLAGENLRHALAIYQSVKGSKKSTGALDEQTWSSLTTESGAPVLIEYVLTDEDVKGPFYPDLPKDYAKLATLPAIGYRSPSQKIGARFHMGETLLASLNPGVDLAKAGGTIVVADVTPAPIHGKVASIVVDKVKSQVLGFDPKGQLLVAYPATIGSQELPSPSGTYKVKGVAFNPIYYYDPKNFLQGDNKEKLKLPPGPNNPVGTVFIALTKPTYGLHGTPDPSKIDKTASHGCVRMTNWDATELAHLVKRGIVVRFKG